MVVRWAGFNVRWLLREKSFLQAAELAFNALDLLPRHPALRSIQFHGRRARQPPTRTVDDRGRYLQIAQQFGRGGALWTRLHLPLRFE